MASNLRSGSPSIGGVRDAEETRDTGGIMTTRYASEIGIGADVYGADGDKIGSVEDVASNYFTVEKGFLFTTDVYVPLSAVTNITDEGIYLNVRKDDIDQQGWTRPPAEDAAATDTYGDTTGGEDPTRR